jgi:tetratricopeptide (TPR) repeat protein
VAAYHPFVIRIGPEAGQGYPVTAEFQGIERSGQIPADLPLLDSAERQQARTWLRKAYIDQDYARDLGQRLFLTLFPSPILEMFREAGQRLASGDRLRVVLNLPLPEPLADLPWELIYDVQGEHGFLARSRSAPLVRRYTDVAFPHQPPNKGPLRVLVATASPQGTPPLSAGQETAQIIRRLQKGLGVRDTLRLLWRHLQEPRTLPDFVRRVLRGRRFEVAPPLHHTTRAALQERLTQANAAGEGFHVVHFIGPGQTTPDGGVLLFEGDDQPDPVTAEALAEMLDEPTLNLVVLNTCEMASPGGLFQSVAEATVRRGVPAVIGMQVPVLDGAVVDFAREFYGAWAAGEPIEVAMAYARRLVRQLGPGGAADWSIPVLYVGHTGELAPQPMERAGRLPWPLRLTRWAFVTFLALLGIVGALLGIPGMLRTIRTEVPVIPCVWPYPMDKNKLTVAFSEFSVVDESGSPVSSAAGQELADFLFKRFEIDWQDLDLRLPYELRPPSHTCAIRGRSQQERASKAAQLAEEINADIVVYGVITDTTRAHSSEAGTGEKPQLALEFYVAYRGFDEGGEIAGPYALGGPLAVELPFDPRRFEGIENPAHLVRIDILNLIAIGLSYYSADNPAKALEYFQQAEQNPYWPRTDGKEIIYLLLGNALIRQAALQPDEDVLAAGYDYYTEALTIEPSFVRAKLGEAATLYMMANAEFSRAPTSTVGCVMLQQSADTYQQAHGMSGGVGSENLEAKVHYGMGQVYLVRGVYCEAGAAQQAEFERGRAEFEAVTSEYEGGNSSIESRAGSSYGLLGTLAVMSEDYDAAIAYYRLAVEHAFPSQQIFYYSRLARIYCQQGRAEEAARAYQDAIDLARLYGYAKDVENYTARLEEQRANGCP